jgi:hypothetical protein
MLATIRKKLTYANVAITVALVFAMTSGAYAADKYLITSINQISPQVLNQLPGNADWHQTDSRRTTQGTLRSGKTEIGVWGFSFHGAGATREPLSFPIPLAAPIGEDSVEVIEPGQEGKQSAAECPGTLEKPAAAPGYLCVYSSLLEATYLGDGQPRTGGVVLAFYAATEKAGLFGAADEGTWAVTAP